MIVPSIDIMDGSTVQLIGGREKALDAGDPRPIARRFARVGEIAVIDLDAALSRGTNARLIEQLLSIAPCRVGGGIRDADTARRWLDAGARKVILGTAATPDILSRLPRDRVIAALDSRDDRVVVEGWTRATSATVLDRIRELRDYVSGFLVTFVEREGRMTGLPLDRVEAIVEAAGSARVTVAGGVRDPRDIAHADALGADTQVGMALYTGAFDLASGFCAPLRSDRPDALWPTIVCDQSQRALGLAYSSLGSVRASIETGRAVYFSRSRNALWEKGATSANTQDIIAIAADCDRDALRFIVRQHGQGFCHLPQATCFGSLSGLAALDRTLADRAAGAPDDSYTARLLRDPALRRSKLLEEAAELAEADASRDADAVTWETADLVFFALATARAHAVSLADIERVFDRRSLRVTRRPGLAKQRDTQA